MSGPRSARSPRTGDFSALTGMSHSDFRRAGRLYEQIVCSRPKADVRRRKSAPFLRTSANEA